MPFGRYDRVLRVPTVRSTLLLGTLVRIPMFAGGVVLTLHVVQTLGRGYAAAGLVTAAATVCVAVSAPWRGRILDRLGLRRTLLPTIAITGVCWSVAPFVGYLPLLVLAALAGLFVVPSFSIVRQALIMAVPDGERRTVLSLDSVATELSFMIGPLLGVWAVTRWSTSWVLFVIEMGGVAADVALFAVNPRMAAEPVDGAPRAARVARREWFTPPVLAVCAAAAATTLVLSGCDVAIVAALREFHAVSFIGPTLALWALGSIVGGLVYGALSRSLPPFLLLAGLGVVTMPLTWAPAAWPLALLTVVAGLFCAPTITATVDGLSRLVPERSRGEAMGWHGSAMTIGSAMGAPVAGLAIDSAGFGAGFASVAVLGLLIAGAGLALSARRRSWATAGSAARDPEPSPAAAASGGS